MNKLRTLFVLLAATATVQARPAADSTSVSVGANAGLAYFPFARIFPTATRSPMSFKPGVSFGLSSRLTTIPVLAPACLQVVLQATHGMSSTGYVYPVEMNSEQLSLLLWPRLTTNSRLAPFVEIGIGYGFASFEEKYSVRWLQSSRKRGSGFVVGTGAGIAYRWAERFSVETHVQVIYVFTRLNIAANDGEIVMPPFHTFNVAGVRLLYHL